MEDQDQEDLARMDAMGEGNTSRTASTSVMTRPLVQAVELGCPGHLIVAGRCRWRRHTQIGTTYRVSTVGDLFYEDGGKRKTVGAGADSFFETMVFRTTQADGAASEGCGCRDVEDYSGLEQQRYATAGAAQAGHEAYVAKYLALAKAEG